MAIGPLWLKVLTTTGTVLCAGASGYMVVLNDPKPASAPLHPPVRAKSSNNESALAPLPPSCGSAGGSMGAAAVTLTAQQQSELQQLRQAPPPQRRALLMTFSAEDRLQISAYQAQHRKTAKGKPSTCSDQTSSAPMLAPQTVAGGSGAAPLGSYVS